MCLFPLGNGLRFVAIHLVVHASTVLYDNICPNFSLGIVFQTPSDPLQIVSVGLGQAAGHERSNKNQHNRPNFHDLPPIFFKKFAFQQAMIIALTKDMGARSISLALRSQTKKVKIDQALFDYFRII
jgi:hypothetical protein